MLIVENKKNKIISVRLKDRNDFRTRTSTQTSMTKSQWLMERRKFYNFFSSGIIHFHKIWYADKTLEKCVRQPLKDFCFSLVVAVSTSSDIHRRKNCWWSERARSKADTSQNDLLKCCAFPRSFTSRFLSHIFLSARCIIYRKKTSRLT